MEYDKTQCLTSDDGDCPLDNGLRLSWAARQQIKKSGVNPGTGRWLFVLSATEYETSARKEPQKKDNIRGILDLDVTILRKYLLKHFYDEIKSVLIIQWKKATLFSP